MNRSSFFTVSLALTLSLSAVFLTSCKKEALVDTSSNDVEDVNGESSFEQKIANGTSMVFFHAVWCSKCAAQRPAFEEASKDMELSFAKFFEVDYEENKEIVDQYNIPGFPTIVIYKDGVEQAKFSGTGHSKEKLAEQLKMYE